MFLGGSLNFGVDDLNINEDDCEQIIKRCSKLMPSLKVFLKLFFLINLANNFNILENLNLKRMLK